MRELCRDGLRTMHHAFNCPRCIRCARGVDAHVEFTSGVVWENPTRGKTVSDAK